MLAASTIALAGAALPLGGGAAQASPSTSASAGVLAAAEPARTAAPTAHDVAPLNATLEANQIAKDSLAAQVEATRWQIGLGLGALVLSGVAGIAAVAAALYARRAWRENQRSADVAERMLTGYERPFLLLEVVKSGVTIADDSTTFDVSRYKFRNLGRVPALITRRHFELEDSVEMPEPIDPEKEVGLPVVHGVAVAANAASEEFETGRALPLHSAFRRSHKHNKRQQGERSTVYFHGFVEYRDLVGRGWVTGFCFAQSDNEVGFQPISLAERNGPDPYNYDRQVS